MLTEGRGDLAMTPALLPRRSLSVFSPAPPKMHLFISAFTTALGTRMVLHKCSFPWQRHRLPLCYWFERLKWPTQRYFSKASIACMDYSYNQENPINILKNTKQTTMAVSSSLCIGGAYDVIPSPPPPTADLQHCLHSRLYLQLFFFYLLLHCAIPTRA